MIRTPVTFSNHFYSKFWFVFVLFQLKIFPETSKTAVYSYLGIPYAQPPTNSLRFAVRLDFWYYFGASLELIWFTISISSFEFQIFISFFFSISDEIMTSFIRFVFLCVFSTKFYNLNHYLSKLMSTEFQNWNFNWAHLNSCNNYSK